MKETTQPPPAIWTRPAADARNSYVLFRHAFDLAAEPTGATLHLFADTRYRLKVNGRTVGHGPARFKRSQPLYDSHDIGGFLRCGANVIAVEVCAWPRGTFISDPGRPGLLAWGGVDLPGGGWHDLAAGPHWRAIPSPEHDPLMPEISFALGPGECRDTRREPLGWEMPGFDDADWPQARVIETPDWGSPAPRPIPPLREEYRPAQSCAAAYSIAPDSGTTAFGARIVGPLRQPAWAAVVAFAHVDAEREITLGWAEGDLRVNGVPVQPQSSPEAPYRGTARVRLRAGWNQFAAFNRYRYDMWELGLFHPEEAGLTFRQAPAADAPAGWLLAGPCVEDPAPARECFETHDDPATPPALPAEWKPLPEECLGLTPMVERGRSVLRPMEDFPLDSVCECPVGRRIPSGHDLCLLFDFGRATLGRIRIELTAPAGTVVDLGYTEQILHGQPQPWLQGTRMVERFVARGGRQTLVTLHPRGMRYLEVTLRGGGGEVQLHAVGIDTSLYPVEPTGAFQCSDPLLNRIWEIGRHTQAVCMEDGYLDCPWRERGIYTGDLLVQYATNLACFGDHALLRHSLELLFRTQDESGLLAPVSHGLPPGRLVDYSAWSVSILAEYWERTGDRDFPRAMRPYFTRVIRALFALGEADGPLIDAGDHSVYLDRSIVDNAGVSCGLNCIVLAATRAAARLLGVLGEAGEAEELKSRADAHASAIRDAFRDPATGLFLDRRRSDRADTGPSAAGNILALLLDLAEGAERQAPLAFILDKMRNNFAVDPPKTTADYHISPYFSHYLFLLLEREGRSDEALDFIREYWGNMIADGFGSFWEFFISRNSLCHAWSTGPVNHLTRSVLGVWPGVDGDPDRIRIAPRPPASLERAEGTLPHPRGPIQVAWRRDQQGAIDLDWTVPDGVTVVESRHAPRVPLRRDFAALNDGDLRPGT